MGSKGMLGQELVKVFGSDNNFEVVGWDRNEIDITDEKKVREKILKLKPEIILNAVAYNAVDKCEDPVKSGLPSDHGAWKQEYQKAKNLNGLVPGYLAKVAKDIDAIFVHYSTDYVFGKEMPEISEPEGCSGGCSTCSLHQGFEPEIGFDEDAKPVPINKYGETKLLGEQEVQKNGEKYYIIRLSKLFGKPAQSKNAKKSFFDIMLNVGKNNKSVKAVDEETSCFTYAPDLAQKTKEIIEAKKEFGIYHIINSDACTWYDAVEELYTQVNLKTKIKPVSGDEFSRPAKRPYFSVLLNTKLNPLRSYKEALSEYLNKSNK